jgi:hypothetical protein
VTEGRQFVKVQERISIPPLPPDNSAEVVVLVRPDEIVLQIGTGRWVWAKHKWKTWTEPTR